MLSMEIYLPLYISVTYLIMQCLLWNNLSDSIALQSWNFNTRRHEELQEKNIVLQKVKSNLNMIITKFKHDKAQNID